MDPEGGGKRAGKLAWVDRRRPATRRAGYSVTASGSEYHRRQVDTVLLQQGCTLTVDFEIPGTTKGKIVGFGGYIYVEGSPTISLASPAPKYVLKVFPAPNWGKFGSQWFSDGAPVKGRLTVLANAATVIGLVDLGCGVVEHPHLANAREALMANMHEIAPEANFYVRSGTVDVAVDGGSEPGRTVALHTKSCNRCGRFLPINLDDERLHLSFSNHCVAAHRRPCSHASFGRLRDVDDDTVVDLDFGFQLECRFCKKFEVNSAHNPQRSQAQMKEDAARRRALELLLTELYGGSASLLYRRSHGGRELADDVYERFGGKCFKCGIELKSDGEWHLDHTRPLAMLWALDGSATALCGSHNSEKRDRPPAAFYSAAELERLATITGVPLDELADPQPNQEAIRRLLGRLDWFFGDFLQRAEMQEVHDGKRPADLLVKALTKVLSAARSDVDLHARYLDWQGHHRTRGA